MFFYQLIDCNPQKFKDICEANESDFQKSDIRIYHEASHASKINLPVLKN